VSIHRRFIAALLALLVPFVIVGCGSESVVAPTQVRAVAPPTVVVTPFATALPRATPLPTLTPAPAVIIGRDGVGQIRIWPGATDRSSVIATLKPGDTVSIIGQQGDHLRVRTADGRVGWVNRDFVQK
jgi:SH3-like domain-containing protein